MIEDDDQRSRTWLDGPCIPGQADGMKITLQVAAAEASEQLQQPGGTLWQRRRASGLVPLVSLAIGYFTFQRLKTRFYDHL